MNNKKVIPLIIISFAALFLILGIFQVVLFLEPELEIINTARSQGVEEQQIADYFRTQLVPQTLAHIINNLGFFLVLIAIGLIPLTLGQQQGDLLDSQVSLKKPLDDPDEVTKAEFDLQNGTDENTEPDSEENPKNEHP